MNRNACPQDIIAGTLAVGANLRTPLRDDVDPVIGDSIARCILCRARGLGERVPDFSRWAARPDRAAT